MLQIRGVGRGLKEENEKVQGSYMLVLKALNKRG